MKKNIIFFILMFVPLFVVSQEFNHSRDNGQEILAAKNSERIDTESVQEDNQIRATCQAYYENIVVTTPNASVSSGCSVNIKNVVINKGAKLVVNATQGTVINYPFTVNAGGLLEIK